MITKLPIKKPALAGEPGFSLLARNAAVNASVTTAEFCSCTGLSKSKIQTGDPVELRRLAELTGSNAEQLVRDSPSAASRKFIALGDLRLLHRSIRRTELSICPKCWLEDRERASSEIYIRKAWLPKPLRSCSIHNTKLIQLPFKDYTSCYDHHLRSKLRSDWLMGLEDRIVRRVPGAFEKAAHQRLDYGHAVYPWLGDQQIDVLEQWALGFGFLVKRGRGSPISLSEEEQCALTAVGHEITLKGFDHLSSQLDAALIRHRLRLNDTWVQQWASQSAAPQERRKFRELMKQFADYQGRYNILNGAKEMAEERYIRAEVEKLAAQTKRSSKWVRRTLRREGLLPASGLPETACLKERIRNCRTYIKSVVNSLTAAESAAKLHLGRSGFEVLVEDGLVVKMRGRGLTRPRYTVSDLDTLLAAVEDRLQAEGALPSKDEVCSIPEACFQYRVNTSQIVQLLLAGKLPNAVRKKGTFGFEGICLQRSDLRVAVQYFNEKQVPPLQLCKHLGLSLAELNRLHDLSLLPRFSTRKTWSLRSPKCVHQIVLQDFLREFQTIATAARELEISETTLRAKVREGKIERATAGQGLPIFNRTDLID